MLLLRLRVLRKHARRVAPVLALLGLHRARHVEAACIGLRRAAVRLLVQEVDEVVVAVDVVELDVHEHDDVVLARARLDKVDGGRRAQVDAELLAVPLALAVDARAVCGGAAGACLGLGVERAEPAEVLLLLPLHAERLERRVDRGHDLHRRAPAPDAEVPARAMRLLLLRAWHGAFRRRVRGEVVLRAALRVTRKRGVEDREAVLLRWVGGRREVELGYLVFLFTFSVHELAFKRIYFRFWVARR